MFTFDYLHSTPTTDIIITLHSTIADAKMLKAYEDKYKFETLCANGCPNYNNKWACPPFSPSYSRLSTKYSDVLLVLFNCDLSQFKYTKTEYMKVKASNSILKSQSDRLMRLLEKETSGTILSNGSCRLCKPCNKKEGLNCKRPDEMRYSMESLGLNVEQISKDFFNHKLLWYKDKLAPTYSSVVTCLLSSSCLNEVELKRSIENYIKISQ